MILKERKEIDRPAAHVWRFIIDRRTGFAVNHQQVPFYFSP